MSALGSNVLSTKKMFFDNLSKFIIDNGIIGTTAGVIIALVSKDLILSLVSDIIVPIFIIIFMRLNIKSLTAILPGTSDFNITNFIKHIISWIITLFVTFFFIKTAFEGILGVPSKVEEKKEEKNKESFYSY